MLMRQGSSIPEVQCTEDLINKRGKHEEETIAGEAEGILPYAARLKAAVNISQWTAMSSRETSLSTTGH